MNEFYSKLAELLEVEETKPSDVLADSPLWDSLTQLSLIAMLDADYGVNLTAADLRAIRTAGDLEARVAARKNG
jgi:acyl carrier protein